MVNKIDNSIKELDVIYPSSIEESRFYNGVNLPPKKAFVSNKPTKVQESPLDAKSPQELLDSHGMYRDPSYYEQNPDKLYLDLTQFDDYETYMNNVNLMKERFRKLPIDVQARFNHNPSELFEYVGSSNFDVETLMDEKTKLNYRSIKAQEKARADFEAFKKTDEYKKQIEDAILRSQYEAQKFAEFKANHTNTDL